MEDYKERVVKEAVELSEKMIKLNAFIFKAKLNHISVPKEELDILVQQIGAMHKYYEILICRLKSWDINILGAFALYANK